MTATTILPKRLRLTKRAVAELPTPTADTTVWDSELPGFGLRCLPTGRRTYLIQRRTRSGRSIRLTIGRASDLTAEQARREAERLVSKIVLGEDPAAERKQGRQREQARRDMPTLEALCRAWTKDRRAAVSLGFSANRIMATLSDSISGVSSAGDVMAGSRRAAAPAVPGVAR